MASTFKDTVRVQDKKKFKAPTETDNEADKNDYDFSIERADYDRSKGILFSDNVDLVKVSHVNRPGEKAFALQEKVSGIILPIQCINLDTAVPLSAQPPIMQLANKICAANTSIPEDSELIHPMKYLHPMGEVTKDHIKHGATTALCAWGWAMSMICALNHLVTVAFPGFYSTLHRRAGGIGERIYWPRLNESMPIVDETDTWETLAEKDEFNPPRTLPLYQAAMLAPLIEAARNSIQQYYATPLILVPTLASLHLYDDQGLIRTHQEIDDAATKRRNDKKPVIRTVFCRSEEREMIVLNGAHYNHNIVLLNMRYGARPGRSVRSNGDVTVTVLQFPLIAQVLRQAVNELGADLAGSVYDSSLKHLINALFGGNVLRLPIANSPQIFNFNPTQLMSAIETEAQFVPGHAMRKKHFETSTGEKKAICVTQVKQFADGRTKTKVLEDHQVDATPGELSRIMNEAEKN